MKIGIDAKWLFSGHPSGKRITENLVESMSKFHLDHEIVLYLDNKFKNTNFNVNNDKIQTAFIWAGNNLLSNIFILPFYAYRNKLDVLISFNYSPLFGNYKRITWILDVIFKSHPKYFSIKERLYFSIIKPLAYLVDHLCTISYSEKQRMLNYGFASSDDKIDVIHLGIEKKFKLKNDHDIEYLNIVRSKYKLPLNYILYVGRLNQRKNLYNLLLAYKKIHINKPILVLAGSPDWKIFNIMDTLEELGIKDSVVMTGYVHESDLPAIYVLAKLFCYVSFEEGFGLPPLEAMASGIPVVVANTSSLPEVCGDAAEYVNPHDPNDIARGITNIIENENHYNYLVDKGINKAKEYSWEKTTKKMFEVIEKIL